MTAFSKIVVEIVQAAVGSIKRLLNQLHFKISGTASICKEAEFKLFGKRPNLSLIGYPLYKRDFRIDPVRSFHWYCGLFLPIVSQFNQYDQVLIKTMLPAGHLPKPALPVYLTTQIEIALDEHDMMSQCPDRIVPLSHKKQKQAPTCIGLIGDQTHPL